MIVGHSWADLDGTILQIDEPVADLLRRRRRDVEGMSYLAITHPADRTRNVALVSKLRAGAGPTMIRKRYLSEDGAEIWASVETARVGTNIGTDHLLGTFLVTLPEQNPRRLWRQAKRLLNLYEIRGDLMGEDLFFDHAWTLMLHLYLAEAEGRSVTLAEVARETKLLPSSLRRWAAVLVARGYLQTDLRERSVCELSQSGLLALERLLVTAGPD